MLLCGRSQCSLNVRLQLQKGLHMQLCSTNGLHTQRTAHHRLHSTSTPLLTMRGGLTGASEEAGVLSLSSGEPTAAGCRLEPVLARAGHRRFLFVHGSQPRELAAAAAAAAAGRRRPAGQGGPLFELPSALCSAGPNHDAVPR